MKIGVNARFLERKETGIGQYTLNLFRKLAQDHPEDEFTLVVRQKIEHKFPPNIRIKVIPEKKWLVLGGLKKGYWEHIQLRKFFDAQEFDIIHFTYPAYPVQGIETPSVTTVHDIIPWQDKRYRRQLRSKLYCWLTKKALKKAPKFLAVSETTKKDFANHFKIDPGKITVTYEAVSDCYKSSSFSSDFKIPTSNYLLYVGGYDVRKNVTKLIHLVSQLEDENLTLVLAGGKVQNNELYDSYDLQKNSKIDKLKILKTGFLDEKELGALYKEAKALINISEKEGFNLPLLEAAYVGVPVITSDIPIHRELYESYAVFLPLDNEQLALKKLKNFMKDPKTPQIDLKEKYNWDITATKTYKAYNLKTTQKCFGSRGST